MSTIIKRNKKTFEIKIISFEKDFTLLYINFLISIFKKLNLIYSIFNLPIKVNKITLLASTHVNKTARKQYKIKKNKTLISIYSNINNNLLKLLVLNKPKLIKLYIKKI